MFTKTQLLSAVEAMPEKVSIDQLIDHLLFLEKVQRGLDESERNEVLSQAEAKEKLGRWLK